MNPGEAFLQHTDFCHILFIAVEETTKYLMKGSILINIKFFQYFTENRKTAGSDANHKIMLNSLMFNVFMRGVAEHALWVENMPKYELCYPSGII